VGGRGLGGGGGDGIGMHVGFDPTRLFGGPNAWMLETPILEVKLDDEYAKNWVPAHQFIIVRFTHDTNLLTGKVCATRLLVMHVATLGHQLFGM